MGRGKISERDIEHNLGERRKCQRSGIEKLKNEHEDANAQCCDCRPVIPLLIVFIQSLNLQPFCDNRILGGSKDM